jgi:hypothetical protein
MDPATPFSSRTQALSTNYGFTCMCALCSWSRNRGWTDDSAIPAPPDNAPALRTFGRALEAFSVVPQRGGAFRLRKDRMLFRQLPDALLQAMHPSYLPALAAAFSQASHDGPFSDALEVGRTLLALYRVVYPAGFPMIGAARFFDSSGRADSIRVIGLHALELSKVAWNALCTGVDEAQDAKAVHEAEMMALARGYSELAREVLSSFGEEGDGGGPLDELRTMEDLLA